MANSGKLVAEPEPIALDWSATALLIIDMQRDFMEPGGFGETHGNDVSQLARAVKPIAAVLDAARETGMLVVHTREGHLPDLSDAPPAKIQRGAPSLREGKRSNFSIAVSPYARSSRHARSRREATRMSWTAQRASSGRASQTFSSRSSCTEAAFSA